MANNQKSSYMRFLPAIFDETGEEDSFIGKYLKIFEKILSGIDDKEPQGKEPQEKKGLGEVLNIIPEFFHPRFSFLFEKSNEEFLPPLKSEDLDTVNSYFGLESRTEPVDPEDFLNDFLTWLASWMDFVLREDWDLQKKREVVARIIPLYRMRGTKKGLEDFLRIYVGGNVDVFEIPTFQVGISQIGINSLIGEGIKPYFFRIIAPFPDVCQAGQNECASYKKKLHDIINLEKPLHTSYALEFIKPKMQIGNKNGSIIGENTDIGEFVILQISD